MRPILTPLTIGRVFCAVATAPGFSMSSPYVPLDAAGMSMASRLSRYFLLRSPRSGSFVTTETLSANSVMPSRTRVSISWKRLKDSN